MVLNSVKLLQNHYSYKTVIAKLVFEGECKAFLLWIVLNGGNLVFGIANSTKVELVASL